MKIIKKDFRVEDFDFNKIKTAVSKSAARISFNISDEQWQWLFNEINAELIKLSSDEI